MFRSKLYQITVTLVHSFHQNHSSLWLFAVRITENCPYFFPLNALHTPPLSPHSYSPTSHPTSRHLYFLTSCTSITRPPPSMLHSSTTTTSGSTSPEPRHHHRYTHVTLSPPPQETTTSLLRTTTATAPQEHYNVRRRTINALSFTGTECS